MILLPPESLIILNFFSFFKEGLRHFLLQKLVEKQLSLKGGKLELMLANRLENVHSILAKNLCNATTIFNSCKCRDGSINKMMKSSISHKKL